MSVGPNTDFSCCPLLQMPVAGSNVLCSAAGSGLVPAVKLKWVQVLYRSTKLLGNFSKCRRTFLHEVNVRNPFSQYYRERTMCFILLCSFGYSKLPSQSLLTWEGAYIAGAVWLGNIATALDWILDS